MTCSLQSLKEFNLGNDLLLKETRLNKSINPPMKADRDITDLLPVWPQSAGCGGALVCTSLSDDTKHSVSIIHTETLLFIHVHTQNNTHTP